ncbi:hypothetical protein D3C78_1049800 [compost metagenome]
MLGTVRKRPDDMLDYDVTFERWLSDGDTITDATAEADPTGVTIDRVEIFGDIVKVWISGGEVGASHKINVTATTAQGRVKEVTFNLRVTEC